MNVFDPHQEVAADIAAPALPGPRAHPAAALGDWMRAAATRMSENPGMWLGLAALYIGLFVLIAFIPVVKISLGALWPVFLGGVMLGCAALDRDEDLEVAHLFAGFQQHFAQLILLGLAYLLAIFLICAVLAAVSGVAYVLVWIVHQILGNGMAVEMVLAAVAVMVGGICIVIALTVLLLIAAIVWLATPLVVLNGFTAWPALQLAFKGAIRNRWPLGLFCLVVVVLSALSVVSALLGFLLWLPLWWITIYSAYKAIFVTDVPGDGMSHTVNI